MRRKTILSWSTGKDSAWALYQLQRRADIEVVGLFTTINQTHQRVSMHGTGLAMLREQAKATRLPLRELPLPDPCPMTEYEVLMRKFVEECRRQAVQCVAFGDLFLADIRAYREQQLAGTDLQPLFPLWGIPTRRLAAEMMSAGLMAWVSCVDTTRLSARLAGCCWNKAMLQRLPSGCDPCGEHGEFHTVVSAGPMFTRSRSDSRRGDCGTRSLGVCRHCGRDLPACAL